MKLSPKGIEILKQLEGVRLTPYLCSAGVPTIGYGSTRYPTGAKVTMKDPPITLWRAGWMLEQDLKLFERDVNKLTKGIPINQNQFDALVLFAYNVGTDIDDDSIPEGLGDSTLLKKVKANPNDPSIRNEFAKWNKANGKVVQGLINRRKIEADLYFS